jgi:hypothetical protein
VTHRARLASLCTCRCSGCASHLHKCTRPSSPVSAARKAWAVGHTQRLPRVSALRLADASCGGHAQINSAGCSGDAPCAVGVPVLLPLLRGQRIPPAQIDMHIKSSEGCTQGLGSRSYTASEGCQQPQLLIRPVEDTFRWRLLVAHHARPASRCCCRRSGDSEFHLHGSTCTSSLVRAAR